MRMLVGKGCILPWFPLYRSLGIFILFLSSHFLSHSQLVWMYHGHTEIQDVMTMNGFDKFKILTSIRFYFQSGIKIRGKLNMTAFCFLSEFSDLSYIKTPALGTRSLKHFPKYASPFGPPSGAKRKVCWVSGCPWTWSYLSSHHFFNCLPPTSCDCILTLVLLKFLWNALLLQLPLLYSLAIFA